MNTFHLFAVSDEGCGICLKEKKKKKYEKRHNYLSLQ